MSRSIFEIKTKKEFDFLALEIFQFQAKNNPVYKEYLFHLKRDPSTVKNICEIPFLPIDFFKSHTILSEKKTIKKTFLSSGTTSIKRSKHHITDLSLYEESFLKGFSYFYKNIEDYIILALLPSFSKQAESSLIYMIKGFIKKSNQTESRFYLNDLEQLKNTLIKLDSKGEKILLIGLSFALLDFIEKYKLSLHNTIIMETGGMKGKRREMIREELHATLKKGFGVTKIHSEYGMTELLSQAYSNGNGVFRTPPWMKILICNTKNPLELLSVGKTGGINIIDLANKNSCSFIATQDLGKTYHNGSFKIIGRFDNSDIRGCNLMIF